MTRFNEYFTQVLTEAEGLLSAKRGADEEERDPSLGGYQDASGESPSKLSDISSNKETTSTDENEEKTELDVTKDEKPKEVYDSNTNFANKLRENFNAYKWSKALTVKMEKSILFDGTENIENAESVEEKEKFYKDYSRLFGIIDSLNQDIEGVNETIWSNFVKIIQKFESNTEEAFDAANDFVEKVNLIKTEL